MRSLLSCSLCKAESSFLAPAGSCTAALAVWLRNAAPQSTIRTVVFCPLIIFSFLTAKPIIFFLCFVLHNFVSLDVVRRILVDEPIAVHVAQLERLSCYCHQVALKIRRGKRAGGQQLALQPLTGG